MIYNRAWLQSQIKSYLHDNSVSGSVDTWIDLGASRISRALRCNEMRKVQEYVLADGNGIPITSDMIIIESLEYSGNQGWQDLRSATRFEGQYFEGSGTPCVWLNQEKQIMPAPYSDGTYRLTYMGDTEVPADDTTTDVMTAYPFIFLNAALAEAYDWKQNPEQSARWEGKWIKEAIDITAIYKSERAGDAPAMRAM